MLILIFLIILYPSILDIGRYDYIIMNNSHQDYISCIVKYYE